MDSVDSRTERPSHAATQSGGWSLFDKKDYLILAPAAMSFLYSVLLWFGFLGAPNKEAGLFVSVWVPSILSLGCFSKLAMKKGGGRG